MEQEGSFCVTGSGCTASAREHGTDAGFVLSWLEILQGCAGPSDVPPAPGGWCLRDGTDG